MTIDRVKELYEDYLSDMSIVSGQSSLRGAFDRMILGSGRQDSCHLRFADKMEKALAGFDFEKEDPDELMDFILCQGFEHRNDPPVALMMTAMQRFLVPFAEHVSPEKAAAVRQWYDSVYEKRDLTPVMKEFRKALMKRAGKK